jgi:hypothetical protein
MQKEKVRIDAQAAGVAAYDLVQKNFPTTNRTRGPEFCGRASHLVRFYRDSTGNHGRRMGAG